MVELVDFVPHAPVPPAIVAEDRGRVPDELVKSWEQYGYGTFGEGLYPGSNLEDFTTRFPEPDTNARVRALLDEAIRVPEPATALSLQQIGARVRTVMRERHPELSEESLHKIGNYVTYLMR